MLNDAKCKNEKEENVVKFADTWRVYINLLVRYIVMMKNNCTRRVNNILYHQQLVLEINLEKSTFDSNIKCLYI